MTINKSVIKFIEIISIFIFTISLISCKKYLDEKSDKSLLVPSTLPDLQKLLDDDFTMNQQSPGYGEASADNYFLLNNTYNSFLVDRQKEYTWQKFDNNYSNDWSYSYSKVYNSNLCLEQLDKIPRTVQNESDWNNVKGSALFFRAYSFLDLAWVFSKAYDVSTSEVDLGIVLRLGSNFNVPSERATVKTTYEQIVKDTKEACSYLPTNSLNVLRPSKVAGYALLARAYLSMREYDSAFKYSDLSLQLKNTLLDYNSSMVNSASNSPYQVQPYVLPETIFFSIVNPAHPMLSSNNALIDTILFLSYENNDKRKVVFFTALNGYRAFKGSYAVSSILFSGLAVDEIYLIRAECFARKGDKTNALIDLNTLLSKRYDATFVYVNTADANAALSRILIERRKELIFRGLRWIDIKRLNKEGAGIIPIRVIAGQTYTVQPNSDKYALPLPADIINITGMPQNPGW